MPGLPPVPESTPNRRKGFREDFKSAFLTGVAALLPTILTLLIFVKALEFVDHHIGQHIRRGLLFIVFHAIGPERIAHHLGLAPGAGNTFLYSRFYETYGSQWYLAILSFLVAITLVYFVGFFVASVAGRGIYRLIEAGFVRLPGVRAVYPYVKQVTDILFTTRTIRDFNRVVAVEYPRRGIYSLGLVTGTGMRSVCDASGEELLNIFIPSSPTPLTGYTIMVPAREIVDLPLTVDQAFKFVISGGVILPPGELTILTEGKLPHRGGKTSTQTGEENQGKGELEEVEED